MTPSDHPYLRLRTPAVICTLMLAGGIGVAVSSHHLVKVAEARTQAAARDLAQTEHALREAEQTASQTREALARHTHLMGTGIGRPADRVAWMDHLESLRKTAAITQFDYEISPEHPLTPADTSADASPVLFANTLHLRAEVPHEDTFLALINRLGSAHTPLRPSRCTLSRLGEAGKTASLTVRCDVDWINLRFDSPDAKKAPLKAPRQ